MLRGSLTGLGIPGGPTWKVACDGQDLNILISLGRQPQPHHKARNHYGTASTNNSRRGNSRSRLHYHQMRNTPKPIPKPPQHRPHQPNSNAIDIIIALRDRGFYIPRTPNNRPLIRANTHPPALPRIPKHQRRTVHLERDDRVLAGRHLRRRIHTSRGV